MLVWEVPRGPVVPIASQAVQMLREPSAVALGPVAVFWKGSGRGLGTPEAGSALAMRSAG